MNQRHDLSLESELRHLPATHRHQLVGLLDLNENWKSLAGLIPNPDRPGELLLKSTDISILEEQRKRPGSSPSNALLEYWGTYGRKRHSFREGISFLEQCGLNRAADLIRSSIRTWVDNEGAAYPKSSTTCNWSDLPVYTSSLDHSVSSQLIPSPSAPNESLISFTDDEDRAVLSSLRSANSEALVHFAYRDIQAATDNFSSKATSQGGTKLGEGSFGEVYRCTTAFLNSLRVSHLKYVAVKRFKQLPSADVEDQQKSGQFVAELKTMYRFQHPNLIRLYGYSNDGPYLCIVTEYLENGSLHDLLTRPKEKVTFALSCSHRLQIAFDVANALVYLHTYEDVGREGKRIPRPYIHRDIKSANILLSDKFGARLGDLGLVRQGSVCNTSTTVVTSTIIGTSVYMAPEAFRGDVSVKIDTFSYGVVLLELLTGMSAFDSSREESDIVSYIDEMLGDEFDKLSTLDADRRNLAPFIESARNLLDGQRLAEVLDSTCLDWAHEMAVQLIILSKCCIEQRKRNRPTMSEVLQVLQNLSNQHI